MFYSQRLNDIKFQQIEETTRPEDCPLVKYPISIPFTVNRQILVNPVWIESSRKREYAVHAEKPAPVGTLRKHERYLFSGGSILVIGKQTNMHVDKQQIEYLRIPVFFSKG